MFRHLFVFRAGTAIVGIRINRDPAARGENSRNLDVLGVHQADKIFHYDIHAVLMESAMIAKTEQIEFQALALHHFHIGNIADADFRKSGCPVMGQRLVNSGQLKRTQ